jgi:nucleoside-diphosphate-sugar epimerase
LYIFPQLLNMPSVLIFGGSGKVAKFITASLVKQDYKVYSVIRRENHVPELRELGATPIIQSLEDSTVTELAATIKSSTPDVVIFAAGAGLRAFEDPNLSILVDRDAAIRVFDAMAEANCTKRLITISTIDARNRDKPSPTWYNEEDQKASDELWGMLPTYVKAKFEADKDLVEQNSKRGLEYTIIRPTWYGDGEPTGKVKAGLTGISPKVSRKDVADVFVACIENPATIECVFEVSGGEVPINEAVQRVAEEKVDSFGEMYR